MYACCAFVSTAGYRAVDEPQRRVASGSAADTYSRSSKSIEPAGGWTEISVTRTNHEIQLGNHAGVTDQLTLNPDEEVVVVARKPHYPKGISVFLYTLHGGLVNGKPTDSMTTDGTGTISFRFQIGPWSGNYPLILRSGGREEEISFWVTKKDEKR